MERFGKFHAILEPGLSLLIPFIDEIKYVHTLKEVVIEIPSQAAITQDNVTMQLDGVLYVKVCIDPLLFRLNPYGFGRDRIIQPHACIHTLLQHTTAFRSIRVMIVHHLIPTRTCGRLTIRTWHRTGLKIPSTLLHSSRRRRCEVSLVSSSSTRCSRRGRHSMNSLWLPSIRCAHLPRSISNNLRALRQKYQQVVFFP